MKKYKFFTASGCILCEKAEKALQGLEYTIYDVTEVNGLTEASYYGILSTPTLIETNEAGEEVQRWGSEAFKSNGE